MCWLEPGSERGCQWREGQRMAQGLSPFLWFNMTPLALRLATAAYAHAGHSVCCRGLPCDKSPSEQQRGWATELLFPPWLRKLSPGLQSPVKTQVWALHSELQWMGVFSLMISRVVVVSHHLQASDSLCKVHYSTELAGHSRVVISSHSLVRWLICFHCVVLMLIWEEYTALSSFSINVV